LKNGEKVEMSLIRGPIATGPRGFRRYSGTSADLELENENS